MNFTSLHLFKSLSTDFLPGGGLDRALLSRAGAALGGHESEEAYEIT